MLKSTMLRPLLLIAAVGSSLAFSGMPMAMRPAVTARGMQLGSFGFVHVLFSVLRTPDVRILRRFLREHDGRRRSSQSKPCSQGG